MEVKLLEVRDRATFIPMLCVALKPISNSGLAPGYDERRYLLHRCGYDVTTANVMMTPLSGEGKATADPYFWGDRTYQAAHYHILKHWDELRDGDVVDVEFILGETATPKGSERLEASNA